MVKSLGKEAYTAARKQTLQRLDPMKRAFIALANENTSTSQSDRTSKSSSPAKVKACEK